jgi:uncharacterized protein YjbJ (UPF0337 family)
VAAISRALCAAPRPFSPDSAKSYAARCRLPTDPNRRPGEHEDIGSEVPPHPGRRLSSTVVSERIFMNKDQVKGRVEEAKGSVKETTGKVVGNDRLQTQGAVDKAVGKAQANYGDAKEKVKDAIDKV